MKTTAFNVKVGDKVRIERTETSFYNKVQWWPENGMTGTVEQIYRNGKIRIACDQLRNRSEDGKISKNFGVDEIEVTII